MGFLAMPIAATATRIPAAELAEHWFSFNHSVLNELQAAFRKLGKAAAPVAQKDIAVRLGKDPATISRCLKGQQNMTLRTIHDLARGMGYKLQIRLVPLQQIQPTNQMPAPQPANAEVIQQPGSGPKANSAGGSSIVLQANPPSL